MQIAFIIISFLVVWVIFGIFYKKREGVIPSIIFTIEITLIVWINIPLLIAIPDNAFIESWVIKIPFELYKSYGWGYTLIANTLLTIVGATASSVISKMEPHCSKKTINKHFNRFIENATSLKMIGKDLDFLLHKDCKRQKEKIIGLKDQVEILCANP